MESTLSPETAPGADLSLLLASGQLTVKDATVRILEDAVARGLPIPSLRAVRARIGKGSMGTISEAINEWKQARLQTERQSLQGFQEEEGKKILDSIWALVLPVITREIGAVERETENRLAIERGELARLRESAEEALAAADNREATIRDLQTRVASLQATLDTVHEQLAVKDAELSALRTERDAAIQEAARATAELSALKALKPFLAKLMEKGDTAETAPTEPQEATATAVPAPAPDTSPLDALEGPSTALR